MSTNPSGTGESSHTHEARRRARRRMLVLGVLSVFGSVAVAVALYVKVSSDARRAHAQLETLTTALAQYHADLGRFPTEQEGLNILRSGAEAYIAEDELLIDPWGRPFIYTCPAAGAPIVETLGADGLPGGTGPNADVVVSPTIP